ncbi:flagellar biosynthesis repressor FlbT [Methylobacterium oxalidis]|nr:flagellar biosynthesis repressor FlbT [Methylobacterium oxalidis]
MHLSLRPGERVYINGAVLRVDRKVSIELLNEATFLLEGHVLQAEEATTPLRQLYFAAQTMLIDPARAEPARALYASLQDGILEATRDARVHERLRAARGHVEAGRLFEVLKLIRALYPVEAALMASSEGAAASPSAPIPPAVLPEPRPKRPVGARKEV